MDERIDVWIRADASRAIRMLRRAHLVIIAMEFHRWARLRRYSA